MDFLTSTRAALNNLRRTTLRSALTTLGIVIGAAAIVVVVSVGAGARAYVEETLASLESNQLQISAQPRRDRWRPESLPTLPPGDGLTLGDYESIRHEISGVAAATVYTYRTAGGGSSIKLPFPMSITGVDVGGFSVYGRRILSGTAFSAADIRSAARTCVIPQFIAQRLFPDRNPVGATLRIGDHSFVVAGVMEDTPSYRDQGPNDPGDVTAYVPYTTYVRRLDRTAKFLITLRAEDPAQLERIQQDVANLLEGRRGNRVAEFITGNVAAIVDRQTGASRTLTLLLGSIAGISLLVGGIGVMNVMLVSVTERTREIGIRMAVGTRTTDIMQLFVIEATVLSLCGGIVGVVLGVVATYLTTYISEWPVLITPSTINLALLCTTAIGVVFGYFPAQRAARLNPIQALRAE